MNVSVLRAKLRRKSAGMSIVEAAIAFAIGGAVVATVIPAFARQLRASRFAEPVEGIQAISAGAVAYSLDRATKDAFPPSVSLTPSAPPRGHAEADPKGTWDTPTWRALAFHPSDPDVPHRYAFAFDSALGAQESRFVARANGDLDGDGLASTFEVSGHMTAGESAVIDPGMVVKKEVE